MPKAMWNGQVIAENQTTIVVDGFHYFPREAVNLEYLRASSARST